MTPPEPPPAASAPYSHPAAGPGLALLLALACLALIPVGPADAQSPAPPVAPAAILVPDQPQPIMPLADVKPGMKGYGMTIFHGADIEPFDVTVVSVVNNTSPKHGVIWITSDDPRMLKSGGAQGMSGSPVYLWEPGHEGEPGQGGRLIGAFAYVYGETVGFLAGVQPIEYMRDVSGRVQPPSQREPDAQASSGDVGRALRLLTSMQDAADEVNASPYARHQLDAVIRMLRDASGQGAGNAPPRSADDHDGRDPRPMLVPLSVRSPDVARTMRRILEPMGLTTAAGPVSASTAPPANVDADRVRLQPGSVLSVPFSFGDLDLAGHGTVTDVLPDGTVLGFGHAMDAVGSTNVPMATGYVHFVVPRLSISFREAGVLSVAGSLLQDEQAAVAGSSVTEFATAPMTVAVQHAQQPARSYQYTLVDNPTITPIAAAICAMESLTAVQDIPLKSTLRFKGDMDFTGGRTLSVDTVIPAGGGIDLAFGVLPYITAMMNNPFEDLKLEGMSLEVSVEDKLLAGSITNASIDRAIVRPGESIDVAIDVLIFGQGVTRHHAEVRIPVDLPEGDYPLLIADAQSYAMQVMQTRPHLFAAESVDDLRDSIQTMLDVKADALYVSLITTNQGIAVGRQEMPSLPSSIRSIIAKPTRTTATPYLETVDAVIDTDAVVLGAHSFQIQVRKPNSNFDGAGG